METFSKIRSSNQLYNLWHSRNWIDGTSDRAFSFRQQLSYFSCVFLINGLSAALMALETEKLWHRMVKGRIEKKLKKELSGIVPEDELEFVIRKIQIDEVIRDIREKVKKNVERKLRHEVEAAMFQQFLETVPEKMERNKRNTVEELEDLKKDIVATRRRSRKLK